MDPFILCKHSGACVQRDYPEVYSGAEDEMIVQKTVRAKIIALTKSKAEKIGQEYRHFQLALKGVDVPLYSATRQQAQRLLKRIKGKLGEQPLVIRRDLFKIQRQDTKIVEWWARIPVYGRSIWVPVQLPREQECLLSSSIRETRLVRDYDGWSLRITVQTEVQMRSPKKFLQWTWVRNTSPQLC